MADHRNADATNQGAGENQQRDAATPREGLDFAQIKQPKLNQKLFDKLHAAALNPDQSACKTTLNQVIADGVPADVIADHYVPAIARELGEQWCVDQLSFAAVTIGSSRLQAMLRMLGPNWSGDSAEHDGAPGILLVVPHEVYHTLGAIVLSGQLRRKGVSVKLLLGGRPREVAERVASTTYDGIFISSSIGETLESLRQIVDAVRTSTHTPPPIVIGGTILDVETVENVTALTGADHATKIPDEALRLCGLHDNTHTKHGV